MLDATGETAASITSWPPTLPWGGRSMAHLGSDRLFLWRDVVRLFLAF